MLKALPTEPFMMSAQPSTPLITTIIPTYRRPKLLRRAVASLCQQTFSGFQVCVYDNASGDETPSVVAELAQKDSRIHYFCQPQNLGPLRNLAFGMSRVETPYFSFLSDDDVLLPEFFQTALAGFEKFPETIASAMATIHVDETGRVLEVPLDDWQPGLYQPPDGLRSMVDKVHPDWHGVLFRREVLEKVGGLDGGLSNIADLDFLLRTAARFPFVVSRQPGAILVIHSAAVSVMSLLQFPWAQWEEVIRHLEEDGRIPLDARHHARRALREKIKANLFRGGLGSVLRKKWAFAEEAAATLEIQYRARGQARMIRILGAASRVFPPARWLLVWLNAIRKGIHKFETLHLQEQFGHYTSLLGNAAPKPGGGREHENRH